MNSNFSIANSFVLAATLFTAVSGAARGDESSMNPIIGDSHADSNGSNLQQRDRRVVDNAPSGWRDVELQAFLSGAGIGQLAAFRIASHVRAQRLKPLLISYVSEHYGLYVYMLRRTFIPQGLRRAAGVVSWLSTRWRRGMVWRGSPR